MPDHYQALEIELSHCCCGEPEIRVLDSSTNRPRERFQLGNQQRQALAEKVAAFERLLLDRDADPRDRKRLSEEIGGELYEILLPGSIESAFTRSFDTLQTGHGLRIRLSFGTPYGRDLGGLPWELLYDRKGRYLANDPRTPVVRFLDLDEPIVPLPVRQQLRVLGVIACPDAAISERYCYSKIDSGKHRAVIANAINQRTKHLHVSFLHDQRRVTASALRDYLVEAEAHRKPFHAIHFLGHGGYDDSGEGALFFERESGEEHLVTGRELAELLLPSVKLVVLASCDTAKIPAMRQGSQQAFTGVGSALLHRGIPAVVAMQFTVSERAAASFAQAFYRMLDRNSPIDEAVTEGRLRIRTEGDKDALEWATPVLFLRARDGKVLDLQTEKTPPKVVAIYNTLDHTRKRIEFIDVRVDLRDLFQNRKIKNPSDWNGTVLNRLRHGLHEQLPAGSPCRIELAAPISVAFATGFLLPVNKRESVTVMQRDQEWHFDAEPPAYAPRWLPAETADARITNATLNFPFTEGCHDIAVVVDGAHSILGQVADYLRRDDPNVPRIGHVIYAGFEDAGHYVIKDGGHAQQLAERLVARVHTLARRLGGPMIHFFSPGPNGLAFAIGRLSHVLPRMQLYEYDKEGKRHGSYEPSITLEPPEMGGRP